MKTTENRIKLEDSMIGIIAKMSDGSPGAVHVCSDILKRGDQIDPQSFAGGLGALMWLDEMGIYGSEIWTLYKDVCGCDLVNLMALVRAWQLGIDRGPFTKDTDVARVFGEVKAQLPQFGIAPATVPS